MSDKDKHQDNDIVASAADAPETIGDEQLEDIDGGAWTLRNVHVSSYSIGGAASSNQPNADTIYGGLNADTIYAGSGLTRPGGKLKPYGF